MSATQDTALAQFLAWLGPHEAERWAALAETLRGRKLVADPPKPPVVVPGSEGWRRRGVRYDPDRKCVVNTR